jgi:hypothetical protein
VADEDRTEFLPPEPPGPEPELGGGPPPPQAPSQQATQQQYSPPAGAQGGWQQAPPQGWQQPPAWGYGPRPAEPDNGPAVAGFVLSLVSGGLLIVSFGLSTIISVACAIFGLIYSGKGKRKVEAGETTKNAGLANAGWIISIVSLVLSILATILYIALVIALVSDEEFRRDFENEFDNSNSIRAFMRIGAATGRLLLA